MRCALFVVLVVGCSADGSMRPSASAPAPVEASAAPQLAGFARCTANHCTFDFAQRGEGDATRVARDRCDETVPDCKPLQGALTSAGLAKARELAARLARVQLERAYGCPGCADGLAYHVVIHHADGRVTKHSADPEYPQELPAVLADAMAFTRAIDDAVSECKATQFVTPSADCQTMREKTNDLHAP
jgi:hypothetical protein